MTYGLLSIDGEPVGPISFKVDLKHELVGELEDDVAPSPSYDAKFEMTMDSARAFADFMRNAQLAGDIPAMPPLYDMTVWSALDPAGAWMPIVNVDANTEVVTRCQRGGGYLGRTWRAVPIKFDLEEEAKP